MPGRLRVGGGALPSSAAGGPLSIRCRGVAVHRRGVPPGLSTGSGRGCCSDAGLHSVDIMTAVAAQTSATGTTPVVEGVARVHAAIDALGAADVGEVSGRDVAEVYSGDDPACGGEALDGRRGAPPGRRAACRDDQHRRVAGGADPFVGRSGGGRRCAGRSPRGSRCRSPERRWPSGRCPPSTPRSSPAPPAGCPRP